MTEKQFLERLKFLAVKMCDLYKEIPVDEDALQDLRVEIHAAGVNFSRRRRRRPWLAFACCIILLIILGFIMYEVLELLWMRGTQYGP